jgi:biopolymer transport protein ExbD
MAGAVTTPTSKRSVDFQLNLIPCIDLLSVLISFLLMTSVWTQIAQIDVKHAPDGPAGDPSGPREALRLSVLIRSTGYTVSSGESLMKVIAKSGEAYDTASLGEVLAKIRAEHPENRDVIVSCEDKVPYQELITVMDTCLQHELTGISVAGIDG